MLKKTIIDIANNNNRAISSTIKKLDLAFWLFIHASFGNTFSEKLFRWCYPDIISKCLVCNGETIFLDFSRGFRKYCSRKCTSYGSIDKKRDTCLKKYGTVHFSKTIEYKNKFKKTCLEKYGVENPGQIEKLKSSRARKKQETFFFSLLTEISDFTTPLFDFSNYNEVREIKKWECKLCGNHFDSHCFNKLPKCPKCFPTAQYGGQSTIEQEIIDFIKNDLTYNKSIIENSREIIPPKEIDIFMPDAKLAIEVCGLYWHSSKFCYPEYHVNKLEQCEEKGIKLLTIFDDEWFLKKDIVKKRLSFKLNKIHSTTSARKCVISQVSPQEVRRFLIKNHLHGYVPSTVNIGLYYIEELMAVATFGRNRFSKKENCWEFHRFATIDSIPGAASRLFKFFIENYDPDSIISYADRCWSDGDLYKKLNFKLIGKTKPNYWYWNKNGKLPRLNRMSYTKKKLVKEGFSKDKTEFQIMEERGFYRIYDCGSYKFRWEAKK